MCIHRRSSGAKGNHLAETAGVWKSAAIRQTSLAPADYLKAQPPPGRLRSPLLPTISFPKSVARIIKLVEERRERGGERDKRKKRLLPLPPNLVKRPVLPHSATYMLSIYRCIPWSFPYLPLCSYSSPLLPPFSFPRVALFLLSLMLFCFNLEVFAKELIGGERVSSFDREFTSGTDPKICSPLARRRPEVVQLESCTV